MLIEKTKKDALQENITNPNFMKLTILVDNNTYIDKYYYGEPAVSYYIETEDNRVLFDTGYSDVILKNAGIMERFSTCI